jgi:hypothetical protein
VLILDEFEVMAGNPHFDAMFFTNLRALADQPEYRFGFLRRDRMTRGQPYQLQALGGTLIERFNAGVLDGKKRSD